MALALGAAWDCVRFFLVVTLLAVVIRGAGGGGRSVISWLSLAGTGNLLVPVGTLLYLLYPDRYGNLLGLLRLGKALSVAAFAFLAVSGSLLALGSLPRLVLGSGAVPAWIAAALFAVLDAAFLVLLLSEGRRGGGVPARAAGSPFGAKDIR